MISRLRTTRLRSRVLPPLLAALVLRALIPVGFMPGYADGASLTVSMCSTQPGKSEIVEIPGEHANPHCDYCVVPPLGVPPASVEPASAPAPRCTLLPERVSQIPQFLLARAQSARAPPHA